MIYRFSHKLFQLRPKKRRLIHTSKNLTSLISQQWGDFPIEGLNLHHSSFLNSLWLTRRSLRLNLFNPINRVLEAKLFGTDLVDQPLWIVLRVVSGLQAPLTDCRLKVLYNASKTPFRNLLSLVAPLSCSLSESVCC